MLCLLSRLRAGLASTASSAALIDGLTMEIGMRRVRRLVGIFVFVGILLGGLEFGLRAFPGELIPLGWLKRMQSDLRVEVAQRLSLPNETQMWELARDDGGPPLKLYQPNAHTEQRFSSEERSNVRRDAQGFCNPPRDSYARASIDVIIMGDSFTGCIVTDPEATWMSRIGQLTGLSVFNVGKGGIGPYDYLQIFQHFGLPKKPRIGLMNIYEGNDLRDAVRYHEHVAAVREGGDGYADASERSEPEIDYETLLDNPLGRSSYAVNVSLVAFGRAYKGVGNAVSWATGEVREQVNFRYELRFDDDATVPFNIQNADEAEVRYARRLQRGEVQLAAFDEALARFVALGREHGFQPVVSYAPSAYTAYADFVAFEDDALTKLMPWFSGAQRAYLREKADELGYAFIDLTPALQAAARRLQARELLYHRANVHYTPAGHRVVGDALARAIMELPRRPRPLTQ
jgi:hypothetical protein